MKLYYYEWATRQFQKYREELCGDSLVVSQQDASVTVALSDGLGSGVKANILATLTTQIAVHLLQNNLSLDEVVRTLSATLPVDQVRKLAYSTFVIAQFFDYGEARLVEFDSPSAILIRGRKLLPIIYDERVIEDKTIREAALNLKEGDWLIVFSDGVLNAGIGGQYPLGWGWDHIAKYLAQQVRKDIPAETIAQKLAENVNQLYDDRPGDDVSLAVVKVRRKQLLTILTGPPAERRADEDVVLRFIRNGGKLVICGGTTTQIVARQLGQPFTIDLKTMTDDVPAMGRMKRIDLITEGILTLTKMSELLEQAHEKEQIRFQIDGASALLRMCFEADHIHFMVGQAVNPAHQNPGLPRHLDIRMAVVRDISRELQKRGKDVTIESI